MQKIMFDTKYGLEQAVIERRKTMTRRAIPLTNADKEYLDTAFDWDLRERVIIDRYAKYKVGEVVAVAQSYKDLGYSPTTIQRGRCVRKSIHGDNPGWTEDMIGQIGDWYIDQLAGWNNKMFVNPSMCNHQIRITDIMVERLQDISDEDCTKEGILTMFTGYCYVYQDKHGFGYRGFSHIKEAFASLIDGVSGKGTWKRNPWVFVYTFKLIK